MIAIGIQRLEQKQEIDVKIVLLLNCSCNDNLDIESQDSGTHFPKIAFEDDAPLLALL